LFRCFIRKEREQGGPAAWSTDGFAHGFGLVAHPFEVAMLEIDARAVAVGREKDFDLGDQVGIVSEFGSQLPNQNQPRWRLPNRNLADLAFGSVDVDLVPATAAAGLDDRAIEVRFSDLVSLGPPAADAAREDVKCARWRCFDMDAFANGCGTNCLTHLGSFLVSFSISVASAVSAPSQNWSSQARIAPSPFGSMW